MTPLRILEIGGVGFLTGFAAQSTGGIHLDPTIIYSSTITAIGFIIVGLIGRSAARESRKANEAAGIAAERAGRAATVADNAAAASAEKLDANAGQLKEVHTMVDGRLTDALEKIELMAQRIEDLGGGRTQLKSRVKSKRRGS